jgi:hypothetical protein
MQEWETYARQAGHEFVAAGRAETAEQRRRLRKSAEASQELARKLRDASGPRHGSPSAGNG